MKYILVLAVVATIVACTSGADYLWGEIGEKDLLLAKDKVTKSFVVGLVVSKKYIFKQKDLDALTITAIRVTDRMSKNGATAQLLYGGPGSKGATLLFKSQRGHSVKVLVEIFGR